ncbi:hypothetical protein Sjap_019591 [Stephania japonica]|uniref:CASP-like protein n=1 Tax=Stephania japonica TaxID=461633 RepID=A0AAP0F1X0_9MAGN
MNGQKTAPDAGIQMPETKPTAEDGGAEIGPSEQRTGRRSELVEAAVRLACVATLVVAVALMVTAEERAEISIYGFRLPAYSKWSFSDSFKYLVGMSAVSAAHSLLQLFLCLVKVVKKSSKIPSKNQAWLIFAGDQVFAFAMMSAGSAASGVTNLNRTGIQHTALPDFCKPLHSFCDRVAVSVAFAFFSCFLLATSVVFDVIKLSRNQLISVVCYCLGLSKNGIDFSTVDLTSD